MTTHTIDYAELAKQAAGNHRKFTDFGWHDRPEDDENWCLVYTNNRDSGLLDQSNAAAIEKMLARFMGRTVIAEHHGHFACGWVDGYAIRVYFKGTKRITKAFKVWCDIQDCLSNYPVLDESDHSRREYEATCKNIEEVAQRVAKKVGWTGLELPTPEQLEAEGHEKGATWESLLWDVLGDMNALESKDDGGGYPSDEQMESAFVSLGWAYYCDECDTLECLTHKHCRYCGLPYDYKPTLHPIEGWEYCSCACLSDGYCGERRES